LRIEACESPVPSISTSRDGVQARLAGERAAKLAHLHGDRDRLGAPVEHAGDDALLAQAPRLA